MSLLDLADFVCSPLCPCWIWRILFPHLDVLCGFGGFCLLTLVSLLDFADFVFSPWCSCWIWRILFPTLNVLVGFGRFCFLTVMSLLDLADFVSSPWCPCCIRRILFPHLDVLVVFGGFFVSSPWCPCCIWRIFCFLTLMSLLDLADFVCSSSFHFSVFPSLDSLAVCWWCCCSPSAPTMPTSSAIPYKSKAAQHLPGIKGTVSRAGLGFWWHKRIDLGLKKRRAWFVYIFFFMSLRFYRGITSSWKCEFALA